MLKKYPIITKSYSKNGLNFGNIVNKLKEIISKEGKLIGEFDQIEFIGDQGPIHESIINAKNIIYCLGKKLPAPEFIAIKPKSIGIVETDSEIIFSFISAPMPEMDEKITSWIEQTI